MDIHSSRKSIFSNESIIRINGFTYLTYNGGWALADWEADDSKYVIQLTANNIETRSYLWTSHFLSFKTADARDRFHNNQRFNSKLNYYYENTNLFIASLIMLSIDVQPLGFAIVYYLFALANVGYAVYLITKYRNSKI